MSKRFMNRYDAYKQIMDAIADWDCRLITTSELHTKVIEVCQTLEAAPIERQHYRQMMANAIEGFPW